MMDYLFDPPEIHPNASFRKLQLLGTVDGVCGGDPIILGTRIKCVHVWYLCRRLGMEVFDIVREYPGLRYEQVNEAILFIDEHPGIVADEDDWWAGQE